MFSSDQPGGHAGGKSCACQAACSLTALVAPCAVCQDIERIVDVDTVALCIMSIRHAATCALLKDLSGFDTSVRAKAEEPPGEKEALHECSEGDPILEWSTIFDGGVNNNSPRRSSIDLEFTFYLETMYDLPGGTSFPISKER